MSHIDFETWVNKVGNYLKSENETLDVEKAISLNPAGFMGGPIWFYDKQPVAAQVGVFSDQQLNNIDWSNRLLYTLTKLEDGNYKARFGVLRTTNEKQESEFL